MSAEFKPEENVPAGVAAWLALVVALAASAGSLMLSMGEGKIACPLCFYQRSFALGLTALLGVGLLTRLAPSGRLAVLALPLAIGGLGVGGWHVRLETSGILECPAGLFDIATAPKQSAAVFALLTILLLVEGLRGLRQRTVGALSVVFAAALGCGVAWASTAANPKLPDPPTKPYDSPPLTCRRPFAEEVR